MLMVLAGMVNLSLVWPGMTMRLVEMKVSTASREGVVVVEGSRGWTR